MTAGFRCKQFFVAHHQCAMKVSTDALLLGAWSNVPARGDILDIGCGSGILSLMLAQRSLPDQHIDAVELCADAVAQARDNVINSPWSQRIRVIQSDILTYPGSADHLSALRYALIVSNPPYFSAALKNPDAKRQQARHNDSLPFAALLQVVAQLLAPNGLFCLILPNKEATELLALAAAAGWFVQRQQAVAASPAHIASRQLLALGRQVNAVSPLPLLLVRDAQQQYSMCYRQLLADFYLKF